MRSSWPAASSPVAPRPVRRPGPVPAASSVTVEVGTAIPAGELTQFDHHLTARWQLYTRIGPELARSCVEHEPWPLHRAAVRELDSGVRTRISAWRPLGRARR